MAKLNYQKAAYYRKHSRNEIDRYDDYKEPTSRVKGVCKSNIHKGMVQRYLDRVKDKKFNNYLYYKGKRYNVTEQVAKEYWARGMAYGKDKVHYHPCKRCGEASFNKGHCDKCLNKQLKNLPDNDKYIAPLKPKKRRRLTAYERRWRQEGEEGRAMLKNLDCEYWNGFIKDYKK